MFPISITAENIRNPRHILLSTSQAWGPTFRDGNTCITSKGYLGLCTSFRQCYPYFKLPDLGIWESWVLGNYDACSYYNDQRQQAFGVCCTNPITPSPPLETEDPFMNNNSSQHNKNPLPNNNNYPSWPPPIPTHPPGHGYPTHPPGTVAYPQPAVTTKPILSKPPAVVTQKPITTTTWPTKPIYSTTTSKYPAVAWPPQAPTRPPPVGIYPTTPASDTQYVTEPSSIPSDGTCGSKNGYQVIINLFLRFIYRKETILIFLLIFRIKRELWVDIMLIQTNGHGLQPYSMPGDNFVEVHLSTVLIF